MFKYMLRQLGVLGSIFLLLIGSWASLPTEAQAVSLESFWQDRITILADVATPTEEKPPMVESAKALTDKATEVTKTAKAEADKAEELAEDEAKKAKKLAKAEAKKAKKLAKAEAKKAKELAKAEAKKAKELAKAEAKKAKLAEKSAAKDKPDVSTTSAM